MNREYRGNAAKQMVSNMVEIKRDATRWIIYFFDKKTKTYWKMDYPNSELQGGGGPRLQLLEKMPENI